jgi:hypothetical protein
MIDVTFLLIAIAFVITATLAALATTSVSPTVRAIANRVVNGSAAAVLISLVLAVWFLCWPPASTVGSPPRLHAQNSSETSGKITTGDVLGTR